MRANSTKHGDILVVDFVGKKLDAANAKEFKQIMVPILESANKFIFDMGNLQFIDSSGLGAILSCLRSVSSKQGEIKLCNLSKSARIIIELVSMHKVFEIFNSVEEGLKAFEL